MLRAQFLLRMPVEQALKTLSGSRWLSKGVAPSLAEQVTVRAGRYLGQLPKVLDSCLVRSLVVGTILSDQPGVTLHIGFRPGQGDDALHEGHAWVTFNGNPVIAQDTPSRCDGDYVSVMTIPIVRGAGDEG